MRNINSAFSTIGFALCLGAPMASWGAQPIQDVKDEPIVSAIPLPVAQVKSRIMVAGTSLGWKMAEVRPGLIQGTLYVRKHTADVEIPYSGTNYSIVYKSSVNLGEKNGQIHKNYNIWVQDLRKKISAELLR